jgi:hypothetical protein
VSLGRIQSLPQSHLQTVHFLQFGIPRNYLLRLQLPHQTVHFPQLVNLRKILILQQHFHQTGHFLQSGILRNYLPRLQLPHQIGHFHLLEILLVMYFVLGMIHHLPQKLLKQLVAYGVRQLLL